jgi:hypothetical protein
VLLFPVVGQVVSRRTDLVIRLDMHTLEYLQYREHTPGTMLIAPADLLNRRMGDIAPDVAAIFAEAIKAAVDSGSMQHIEYMFRGYERKADVIVAGQQAIIGIKAVSRPAVMQQA